MLSIPAACRAEIWEASMWRLQTQCVRSVEEMEMANCFCNLGFKIHLLCQLNWAQRADMLLQRKHL